MAERRYTVVFYGSLLVATAATFGVYRVLEANKASSRIVTRPVIVATRDIADGVSLERRDLRVDEWPVQAVPAGAYQSIDSVLSRVTRVAVFKGEPLVPGRLAPVGTAAGLESKITPGKRAIGLRINDVAGISGLIQPGSRVDVLVTLRDASGRNEQMAKLFMENLRVLSVGSQVEREEGGDPIRARTVTVEVEPADTERLALAQRQGTIQLVLRGFADPDSARTTGATISDVVARLRDPVTTAQTPPAPRPVRRRPPPQPTPAPVVPETVIVERPVPPKAPDSVNVRVYRGDKVTQQKVERTDPKPDTAAQRRASGNP